MKVRFLPATYTKQVRLPQQLLEQLPETVCLYTTIQFASHVPDLVAQLEKAHKKVVLVESTNYYYDGKKTRPGQLLGCNQETVKGIDAFLYVGDGLFHPKILMVKNDQPLFGYDPIGNVFKQLGREEMERLKKKRQGALSVFQMSQHVGVLVSAKPGQNLLERALKLTRTYPDKQFYFVVFNDINFGELENFPFVQCWVNTACYRLALDDTNKINKPVVNLYDL